MDYYDIIILQAAKMLGLTPDEVRAILKAEDDDYARGAALMRECGDDGGHECDCGHGDPCYECNLERDN